MKRRNTRIASTIALNMSRPDKRPPKDLCLSAELYVECSACKGKPKKPVCASCKGLGKLPKPGVFLGK